MVAEEVKSHTVSKLFEHVVVVAAGGDADVDAVRGLANVEGQVAQRELAVAVAEEDVAPMSILRRPHLYSREAPGQSNVELCLAAD